MSGISAPELIVILVIALIVLGAATAHPGKLPPLDSAQDKGIRDFRNVLEGADEDLTKIEEKRDS